MEFDDLTMLHRKLGKIQKDVPVVKYAVGLAGIAASISVIIYFVGDTQAAVRLFGATFIGMILLIVLTVMEQSAESTQRPAKLLMWVVVAAFAMFIFMTVSVFVFEWPCAWMRFLEVAGHSACEIGPTSNIDSEFIDPLSVVPKNVSPGVK